MSGCGTWRYGVRVNLAAVCRDDMKKVESWFVKGKVPSPCDFDNRGEPAIQND